MNRSFYLMHPLWGLNRIYQKAMRYIRGLWVSIIFESGNNLQIGKGGVFDCLNIQFGSNVVIGQGVHIFGRGKLTLGNNVMIGDGTIICIAKEISIGNDTMIAAQCYITDCNHGMHLGKLMREQPVSIKPTIIGSDVWLGCGCKVLAGANIKDGTVLGAGTILDYITGENEIIIPPRDNRSYARR